MSSFIMSARSRRSAVLISLFLPPPASPRGSWAHLQFGLAESARCSASGIFSSGCHRSCSSP